RSLIRKLNERTFTSPTSSEKEEDKEMKLRAEREEADFSLDVEQDDAGQFSESESFSDEESFSLERTYSAFDERRPLSIEGIVERYFSKLER
ncbi:MAG: hypothetical protein QXF12_07680, partial [Candidatus Aenigmatarchaeota archaeon]